MTKEEWLTEGIILFGKNPSNWKFKCPACGHIASAQDYKEAGAPSSAIGFSCIGRWREDSKEAFDDRDKSKNACNYSSGGLINLNPVQVGNRKVFEFGV